MSQKTREQLTAQWIKGFKPRQPDYTNLFDSVYIKLSDEISGSSPASAAGVYYLDCGTTTQENPYIAGTNGESGIICYKSVPSASGLAFIALPNFYDAAYIGRDLTSWEVSANAITSTWGPDHPIRIDASYFGVDEVVIGSDSWTYTNNLIQNNNRDIRLLYPAINPYMEQAIRLGSNQHITCEFYPAPVDSAQGYLPPYSGSAWNTSDGVGLMLSRTQSGGGRTLTDGFGNNAQLDSFGFVNRWTHGEGEYLAHKYSYSATADMDIFGLGWTLNWTPEIAGRVIENAGATGTFLAFTAADVSGAAYLQGTCLIADFAGIIWVCGADRDPSIDTNWINTSTPAAFAQRPIYRVPANINDVVIVPPTDAIYWKDDSFGGIVFLTSDDIRQPGHEVTIRSARVPDRQDTGQSIVAFYDYGNCESHYIGDYALGLAIGGNTSARYAKFSAYDNAVLKLDRSGRFWQFHAGTLITLNNYSNINADGWGNSAKLNINGKYLKRFTLSEQQFEDNITNVRYHNHQAGIEGIPLEGALTVTEDVSGGTVTIGVSGATTDTWYYTDNSRDSLVLAKIPMSEPLPIALNAPNYICADGATQSWVVLPSSSLIDYIRYIPYMVIFRQLEDNHMHMQIIDMQAHGDVEMHHQRVFACTKYDREKGALESFSIDPTTFAINLNGGGVWSVNHRNIIKSVSASSEQYVCIKDSNDKYWYYDFDGPTLDTRYYSGENDYGFGLSVNNGPNGAGGVNMPTDFTTAGWIYQINNPGDTIWTDYGASGNDAGIIFQAKVTAPITGTGTLYSRLRVLYTDLWSIMYVYRGIESEDHLYTFFDSQGYATLELAKATQTMPIIPPLVSAHAMQIGRIIFKGQTVDASEAVCESSFNTIFQASSTITIHNSLSGRDEADAHPQYVLNGGTISTASVTAGTISIATSLYFTAEFPQLMHSGNYAINFGQANKHAILWGDSGNVNITLSPPLGPTNLTVKIVKSGTNASILSFAPAIKYPGGTIPVFTGTDGAIDILNLYYDGTNYYGSALLDML